MIREKIVDEVTRILHGPMAGNGELLNKNPLDFYTVGILFPCLFKTTELTDDTSDIIETEEEVVVTQENKEQSEDEKISKRRAAKEFDENGELTEFDLTTKFRPSAAGVSVLTFKKASIRLKITFGTYQKQQIQKQVIRGEEVKNINVIGYKHLLHEFSFEGNNGNFDFGNINIENCGNILYIPLNDSARLSITTRKYPRKPDMEIKTFTLINSKDAQSFKNQKTAEACLFQPRIILDLKEGFQPFEDLSDLSILSSQDLNLKLLYRNYEVYALGHGISVNWTQKDDVVQNIFTEVLPKEEVHGVDFNPPIFQNKNILFIKRLSGPALNNDYNWQKNIKPELLDFTSLYDDWIKDQKRKINGNESSLPAELILKAKYNLEQCEKLSKRMYRGIELLDSNEIVRKAFEDSNRAMFMQRVMADFSKHRREEKRVQHDNSDLDDAIPNYSEIPYNAISGKIFENGKLKINKTIDSKGKPLARWRPFQLSFLLSQIEGIMDPESEDRDTVDLIWFPTGGGKTEAYLGLTAFIIFFRRLNAKYKFNNPDEGAGVTVVMRYTLRLLNKQQFDRANIIICACDLIRRLEPGNYGNSRISNGIWMGRSMTPNNEDDQIRDYQNYINQINNSKEPDTFRNSPPLLSCPSCGNRLVKEVEGNKVIGRWGYIRKRNNRNRETGRYLINCTNIKCDFHVSGPSFNENSPNLLPVYEVDETIYNERPSLLFSTVDKFVQLAWKSESFNLFNIQFEDSEIKRLFPAPELIIQDELHLISSALGTIYGVYEIVIDNLCREGSGKLPKILGATATVRNAEEQCKKLYARKNFLQFPPAGINADDSFYAKKMVSDPNNRLYIGFMPSGTTSSTALIRLASVLLERIPTLNATNDELDKYYTLVVYFNALKELGKFRTFLTDDIVAYRKLLANHFKTFIKPFDNNTLCELSSVMTADEITTGLDRLEKTTLPNEFDGNNLIFKRFFETGIRTLQDLKNARGSVWKDIFINKLFFDQIGLDYKDDFSKDIQTFISYIENIVSDKACPIQIAPATNMISVGVDIPRLNTMIVVGQPKTSAEYIQASSRVGRDGQGVVFTFLAPTKNRDRSHYENFKAFHQAYYYFVESTSVTPFSVPALEKVLPTVFIALTRSLFLKGSRGIFSSRDKSYIDFISTIAEEVKTRSTIAYKEKSEDISNTIEQIKLEFLSMMENLNGERRVAEYIDFLIYNSITGRMEPNVRNHMAVYNAPAEFTENILKDHVPTMQTLRNVESSTKVSIKS